MKTMSNVYPSGYLGDGIFSDLQSYNVPWHDENINAQLDMLYYSKSGDKYTSNIINRNLTDDELTNEKRDVIAHAVFAMYQTQWDKLYSVLFEEYNPIENYRMTETETTNHTIESTNANTGTVTTTDTGTIATDNDTETTTANTGTVTITNTGTVQNQGTDTAANSVYGFNSSSAVNSDETSGTNSATETRNLSQQETRNTTDTETVDGTVTETRNTTNTETLNTRNATEETGENERELTRSGNIGVTTSQQLLQSEIELWQWNYFNQVFADIDKILCLSIY